MWYAFILGLVQGLTEFLPISSSGHLVLVQSFFSGFAEPNLVFDVLLHAGTLLAVLLYFQRDLRDLASAIIGPRSQEKTQAIYLAGAICLASVPAAVLGLTAEDYIESLFKSPIWAGICLLVTGLFLSLGEFVGGRITKKIDPVGKFRWIHYIFVGCAQACALMPGISRSGSTIAAGLAMNWSREKTARFSFLLMIPAVSGAVVLKIPDAVEAISVGSLSVSYLIVGFLTAAVSGFMAIDFLLRFIKTKSLIYFAVYCWIAGTIAILMNV